MTSSILQQCISVHCIIWGVEFPTGQFIDGTDLRSRNSCGRPSEHPGLRLRFFEIAIVAILHGEFGPKTETLESRREGYDDHDMQLNSWFKPWQFRDWRMKSSNIFLQDPQGPFVEGTIVWLPVWGVASTPFRTHPGAPRSKIRFFPVHTTTTCAKEMPHINSSYI